MSKSNHILDEFWHHLRQNPVLMLGLRGQHAHSEPMTAHFDPIAVALDRFFLFTHRENRLVQGIAALRSSATATFASKHHDFYASLVGQLDLVDDRRLLDHFWSDEVAAWFEGGRKDPGLTLLAFQIEHVEMWQTDLSLAGKLKCVLGASIERSDLRERHLHASL